MDKYETFECLYSIAEALGYKAILCLIKGKRADLFGILILPDGDNAHNNLIDESELFKVLVSKRLKGDKGLILIEEVLEMLFEYHDFNVWFKPHIDIVLDVFNKIKKGEVCHGNKK